MRPLPFPSPLHIGTDICHIPRIIRILQGGQCSRFVHRVLTPQELRRIKPSTDHALKAVQAIAAQKFPGTAVVSGAEWDPTRGKKIWSEEKEQKKEEGGLDGGRAQPGGKEATAQALQPLYRDAGQFLAGRFAAKEAAFKAHPHLDLGFHDVLILPASEAAKLAGERLGPGRKPAAPVAIIKTPSGHQMAKISISHDAHYSTATCIGFEAEPEGTTTMEKEPSKGWFGRASRLRLFG